MGINRPSTAEPTAFDLSQVIHFLLAFIVALAPPIIFSLIYGASGPLAPIVLLSILPLISHALYSRSRSRPIRYMAAILFWGSISFSALVILILVSITSSATYSAWFTYIAQGSASSTISYYFSIKFMFFGSIAAVFIYRKYAIGSIALLSFVYCSVFAVMYQELWLIVLAVVLLIYAFLYFDVKRRGSWSLAAFIAIGQIIVLCLVLAALFQLYLPQNQRTSRSNFMPQQFNRLFFQIWPDFPLAVDIPGFGGPGGTNPIDGRPSLSSVAIFGLSTQKPQVYLKTLTFDVYENSSWRSSSWLKSRAQSEDDIDLQRRMRLLGSPTLEDDEIRVNFLPDFYSNIPYTLDTRTIEFRETVPELMFSGQEAGLITKEPFPGDRQIRIFTADNTTTNGEELHLEENAKLYYLAVNSEVREEVRQLAPTFASDDALESIRAIQSWMKDNYSYTLDYPIIGRNSDVVSHFITQGESGYCVQFASSMAILLRLLDIPTRYVTGYYVVLPPGDDSVLVTGLHAHAWVEAWIEGQGWITVEATPPMMSPDSAENNYYSQYNPYEDAFTDRQLRNIMGARIEPPEPLVVAGNRRIGGADRSPLLISIIALASIVIVVLTAAVCLLIFYRFSSKDRRLYMCLFAASRLCRIKHFPPVEQSGWIELIANLEYFNFYPAYDTFTHDLLAFLYSDYDQRPGTRDKDQLLDECQRMLSYIIKKPRR